MGPSINSPEMIGRVLEAGVDVFRLNFSHGSLDDHRRCINWIRSSEIKVGKSVAILQDLPGPKIRIGKFKKGNIRLEAGDFFTLTTDPVLGDCKKVSVNYPNLPDEVSPSQRLLLADGLIELIIENIKSSNIVCRVVLGGILSDHKGVTVPRGASGIPAFTEEDQEFLLEGLKMGIDMAALSFVRNSGDLKAAQKLLLERNVKLPLMAKIEKPDAIDAIDGILSVVDALMLARGDLGVEIPYQNVPLVQKDIIKKALGAGRPVITATQMLRSMVQSPRPTRAEAADVANAVLDGSDAVMLSEETAIGSYPVEAVQAMASIIETAEQRLFQQQISRIEERYQSSGVSGAISNAACLLALEAGAKAIVCCTRSGYTARMAARNRTKTPIIAVSPEIKTVRSLTLVWGVRPILSNEFSTTDGMIRSALEIAQEIGGCEKGDRVIIVGGSPTAGPGHTDFLRVGHIP